MLLTEFNGEEFVNVVEEAVREQIQCGGVQIGMLVVLG